MTCPNCRRLITEADERTRIVPMSRDEPSYEEAACRFCAPTADEIEALRDYMMERRFQEARER